MKKKPTLKREPSKRGRTPVDVDSLRVKIFYEAPKALNDAELAKFLNISEATYYNLKAKNLDFIEAIKHYRRISPIEVLQSFKKIAVGFTFDEETKELQKNSKTGKYEMVVTKSVKKYIAPSATAGFNYLKNQMPEEFRDRIETEHTFKNSLSNIVFVIEGTQGDNIVNDKSKSTGPIGKG